MQARGPEWLARTKEEARTLMRARRHLAPNDEDNFGILGSDNLMGLWQNLTGTLASGMVGLVSIFLVIGGVVIMNVMLASVTERTREIGIRKSLGAKRRDILLQFLVESTVMALVGGAHRRADRLDAGGHCAQRDPGSDVGSDIGGGVWQSASRRRWECFLEFIPRARRRGWIRLRR